MHNRKNGLLYIGVFLIPVIILLIHMVLKGCYPFGDNTVLYGDGKDQYIYFYRMLREIISEHGSLMYNIDYGMGMDMYSNFWYYLANPFTWVVMLFGASHIELGLIVVMLINIGACAVTAYYYFSHTRLNKLQRGFTRNMFCAVCALAYALCDYILAYQFNVMWMPCLALIPIVMYGIELMFYDNKYKLYMLTLFLSFIFNFYFAWFTCIIAVIWFVDQTAKSLKEKLRKFLKFAGASVLSAMCAAFVLVPCYLAVMERSSSNKSISTYSEEIWGNIGDFFQGFLWGHEADLSGNTLVVNNLYCGIFVIFLFVMFIFNGSIPLYRRIKRISEIVVLTVAFNWIYTVVALQGFHYTITYNSRFMFILVILLIITAIEGLGDIISVRLRWLAVSAALFVVFYCVMLFCTDIVVDILSFMVSAMISIYLLICLVLYKKESIKKAGFIINVIIIGGLEIISNPFFAIKNAYTVITDNLALSDLWSDAYEAIDSSECNRKASWMYDGANLFYYTETSLFSSCIDGNIIDYGKKLGMNYLNSGVGYTYKGTTPLITTLYNVRYVLTTPRSMVSYGGYSEIEYTENYSIYESQYIVGLAYMTPEKITDWNIDQENPFDVQNDLTENVLGCGKVFTELDMTDIVITGDNCAFNSELSTDNSTAYVNLSFDESSPMYMVVSYDVTEDNDLYAYISDDYKIIGYYVYIDGELYGYSNRVTVGDMIHIGQVSAGQKIDILIQNGSDLLCEGKVYYMFYSYDEEVMSTCIDKLSAQIMDIETCEDTNISGTIDVTEEGILYIAVPYSKGFTAYVDNEKAEIIKIGDTMMGIYLGEGSHKIELKYLTYGLIPGIIISILGVAIIIVICMYNKRCKIAVEEKVDEA